VNPLTRVLKMAGAFAAIVVVLTGSVTAFLRLLSAGRVVSINQLPPMPVALVLGAQVHPDLVPSGFLQARLDLAAQLYARGLVDHLLLSGDGRSRFYDEPATMRAYLLERGVPESAMTVDAAGLDTFASCRRAREEYGWRELVVVSQQYHLPRAIAICALVGIDAWGVGDESMRRSGRIWRHGSAREAAANLKVIPDLVGYWRNRPR
jgi:vancomycin permeability regulator SanA